MNPLRRWKPAARLLSTFFAGGGASRTDVFYIGCALAAALLLLQLAFVCRHVLSFHLGIIA